MHGALPPGQLTVGVGENRSSSLAKVNNSVTSQHAALSPLSPPFTSSQHAALSPLSPPFTPSQPVRPHPTPQHSVARPAPPLPAPRRTRGVPSTPSPARKRPRPSAPPASKSKPSPIAACYGLTKELGECIARDVDLLQRVGWNAFVKERRGEGDFSSLRNLDGYPARRLLSHYKHHGVPVKLSTPCWSKARVTAALARGPHKSCGAHIHFLNDKFVDMIRKGQWVILPSAIARKLKGLRVSPPGVVDQRDRRPCWICDYTWSGVNDDTLPLAAMEAMQFGHALERVLREVFLANPAHGHVRLNKTNLSDVFCRIGLGPNDCPKLGVAYLPDAARSRAPRRHPAGGLHGVEEQPSCFLQRN